MIRRLFAVVALAVTLVLATGVPVAAHDEEHADHSPLGNPMPTDVHSDHVGLVTNREGTGGHVVIQGNRLYLGAYGHGMRIYDISNPANPVQIGAYLPGGRADAPPDAAVFDGRHIAVLNGTRRTRGPVIGTDRAEFLDVTNAAAPKVLWTFGPDTTGTAAHADGESHNGDIVDVRRWWLPSGGIADNGLRIYDMNPLLRTPAAAPARLFPSDACRNDAAILCDPVTLWKNSPYRKGRDIGAPFTHTHDKSIYTDYPVLRNGVWVKRDILLLAEGGNYGDLNGNTGSMFVIDITNPRNPVVLNRWLHARGTGHHPIRYHHEAQFVHGLKNVVLVTDEDLHEGSGCIPGSGGVWAMRLSDDLTSTITELSEWFIPTGTPAPVCSVHVMSSYAGIVYFGSYNAGLQIVDYRNPAKPRWVDHYIAAGATSWGAQYHRGFVYVGDMSRGLDVFHYERPDLTLKANEVLVSGHHTNHRHITVTVRNVGHKAVTGAHVHFRVNGRYIGHGNVYNLAPGASKTVSFYWSTPTKVTGWRTFTVDVDPANSHYELSEINNKVSRSVYLR